MDGALWSGTAMYTGFRFININPDTVSSPRLPPTTQRPKQFGYDHAHAASDSSDPDAPRIDINSVLNLVYAHLF